MNNSTPTSISSPGPRYVSASDVRTALPVTAAVAALRDGFSARSQAELEGVPRSVLPVPRGHSTGDRELLLMPAHGPEGAGLKLVTIVRDNPARGLPLIQGLYILLSRDGLTPELLIDGAALTGVRTAAVSALATTYLARPSSKHLVVFGAGAQGIAHVEAMRTVLPIERVTVICNSPQSPRAISLITRLQADGVEAQLGSTDAIRTADVICTCTTSTAPVFNDHDVRAGTHINAIGAYRLDMRELASATLQRALLVVESREAALEEAGDVVAAIEAGALPKHGFAAELREVVERSVRRESDDQVTIFKSVGLSVEDLILARAIADALRAPEPAVTPLI